jgi:hypothetical protein
MGDWLDYVELNAKARTGVSANVLISGAIIAVAGLATLIWFSITLYLWLTARFGDPILAGLVLSAIFLAVTSIAVIIATVARRRARQRAEAALEARKAAALFDPSLLTVGFEIGRAIGWRRVAAVAGVALLASGLIKEWSARKEPAPGEPPPDEPPRGES